MQIHDVQTTLIPSDEGFVIKRTQEIPDEFLDHLKDERFDSISTPAGEMHRVGAVPAELVERWMAQGFNVYEAPVADTIKRLKLEGFDKFLTSNKRI